MLKNIAPPKDYSNSVKPRTVIVESRIKK